jgi:hypothetical protein
MPWHWERPPTRLSDWQALSTKNRVEPLDLRRAGGILLTNTRLLLKMRLRLTQQAIQLIGPDGDNTVGVADDQVSGVHCQTRT